MEKSELPLAKQSGEEDVETTAHAISHAATRTRHRPEIEGSMDGSYTANALLTALKRGHCCEADVIYALVCSACVAQKADLIATPANRRAQNDCAQA